MAEPEATVDNDVMSGEGEDVDEEVRCPKGIAEQHVDFSCRPRS